jgi:hypothetical protein
MQRDEVVLPFPNGARRDQVPPVTHAKGQWLISSVRGIREAGHMDAYLRHLAPEHRRSILESGATDWHPMDVMMAHYAACEALDLPSDEIFAVGARATQRAQGTVIGVTTRLATNSGVTPWSMLPQFQRFWSRMMRGGGVAVWKLGPKEARVEVAGFPPARYRYCRIGTAAVVHAAVSLLCTRAYVTEAQSFGHPDDVVLRLSWV